MKAAGITLSTVGAGGGANPFLEGLAQQGGGRFYDAVQPGQHPGHLPQGDAAGLRRADRRGAVLPDPDLVLADPARPRGRRPARSCAATTARPPSRPPRPSSSRAATTRSWPSGSTAWADPSRGRRTRRVAGRETGWPGTASRGSSASSSAGRSRARRPTASRRRSTPSAAGRACTSRASSPTARRATSTRPRASLVGPGLEPTDGDPRPDRAGRLRGAARRDRPGRLRHPGDPDAARDRRRSGGRSGSSPRPPPSTALLGANEPFLAALRTATGGGIVARRWIRGSTTSPPPSRFTELWPLLLVIALLLWPLDIALRRVSIGRREFASAGAWVRGFGHRRGRVAARTAASEGLLAARNGRPRALRGRRCESSPRPGRRGRGRACGRERADGRERRRDRPARGAAVHDPAGADTASRNPGGSCRAGRHDGPPPRRETPSSRALTVRRVPPPGDSLAAMRPPDPARPSPRCP